MEEFLPGTFEEIAKRDNLVVRVDSIYIKDGWIVRHILRTKRKRGGFGLSRGFG